MFLFMHICVCCVCWCLWRPEEFQVPVGSWHGNWTQVLCKSSMYVLLVVRLSRHRELMFLLHVTYVLPLGMCGGQEPIWEPSFPSSTWVLGINSGYQGCRHGPSPDPPCWLVNWFLCYEIMTSKICYWCLIDGQRQRTSSLFYSEL